MNTYETLSEKTKEYGERNDCSVKAVALTLNTSYEDAHTILKEHGRKDYRGVLLNTIYETLRSRGFEIESVEIPKGVTTINSFEKHILKGKFDTSKPILVLTSSHIVTFIDGVCQDYTSGRRHRIINIDRIIPTDQAVYTVDTPPLNLSELPKTEQYKFALVHIETGKVYKKYKRKPGARTLAAIDAGALTVVGKEEETRNKLKIINL